MASEDDLTKFSRAFKKVKTEFCNNLYPEEDLKSSLIQHEVFTASEYEEIEESKSKIAERLFSKLDKKVKKTKGKLVCKLIMALDAGAHSNASEVVKKLLNDTQLQHFISGNFPKETCNCKKDCQKKPCSCYKRGIKCRLECHKSNTEHCKNMASKDDDDTDRVSELVAGPSGKKKAKKRTKRDDQPTPKRVKLKCTAEPFDESKHNARWHSNDDFELVERNMRMKKCHGCLEPFEQEKPKLDADGNRLTFKFVIRHAELKSSFNPKTSKEYCEKGNAFYHCCASCVSPRHPYFKPSDVKCNDKVLRQLTPAAHKEFEVLGVDLSHLKTG